jgi:hypothetical protein
MSHSPIILGENKMAEYNLTADPFFHLSREVGGLREKVGDSVFENYKLSVAQTNDINNRAMQVALANASSFADLKQATSKGTLETMLAAARTDAVIGATAAQAQRTIMEQGEITRNLINGLNTENLNTALINTNVAFSGLNGQYSGLGLAYGGAVSAVQSANSVAAINAVQSSVSGQRFVNTGVATSSTQLSTPTNIG